MAITDDFANWPSSVRCHRCRELEKFSKDIDISMALKIVIVSHAFEFKELALSPWVKVDDRKGFDGLKEFMPMLIADDQHQPGLQYRRNM